MVQRLSMGADAEEAHPVPVHSDKRFGQQRLQGPNIFFELRGRRGPEPTAASEEERRAIIRGIQLLL
jgi:hypothetical protein